MFLEGMMDSIIIIIIIITHRKDHTWETVRKAGYRLLLVTFVWNTLFSQDLQTHMFI